MAAESDEAAEGSFIEAVNLVKRGGLRHRRVGDRVKYDGKFCYEGAAGLGTEGVAESQRSRSGFGDGKGLELVMESAAYSGTEGVGAESGISG